MKVYVSELPTCCEDCVCHNGVSGRCKLLHRTTFDIPPRDCPLQSLAEHDKQVKKQVCDEIKKQIKSQLICFDTDSDYKLFKKILKQIQGENKELATKENYTLACRKAKELFLGQSNDN